MSRSLRRVVGNSALMGRQNTKHSPRIDDQLKHEELGMFQGAGVDPRTREDLTPESPTEGEPQLGSQGRPDIPLPGPMSIEDVEARSELSQAIAPAPFPCDKAQLLAVARDSFATDNVITSLRDLPDEWEFANVEQVWEALGGSSEGTHTGRRQD